MGLKKLARCSSRSIWICAGVLASVLSRKDLRVLLLRQQHRSCQKLVSPTSTGIFGAPPLHIAVITTHVQDDFPYASDTIYMHTRTVLASVLGWRTRVECDLPLELHVEKLPRSSAEQHLVRYHRGVGQLLGCGGHLRHHFPHPPVALCPFWPTSAAPASNLPQDSGSLPRNKEIPTAGTRVPITRSGAGHRISW